MPPDRSSDEILTRAEVAEVADLALLDLTDDEIDRFTPQLAAVLDRARELDAVGIDGVEPTFHPYELTNVLRDDEPEILPWVRDEALAAAPEVEDGRFRVPPALGEQP
ncbi:MAG: Asp-tRNA(Asn)/Glu-tRNA(Gln) amidotransferase subunit GatC [Acidimicrobiales bacterium]